MKFLIIQLKRAGDVILTTPIAGLLKRHRPGCQVDFLVDAAFAPLLENHPDIDAIRRYDRRQPWKVYKEIRSQKYDEIFDFQSSPRSAILVLASGAQNTAGYRVPFWGRMYGRTVQRPGEGLSVAAGKATLLERVFGVGFVPGEPTIAVTPEERTWAKKHDISGRKSIGLVPTHRRDSRRWHAESFADLAIRLDRAGYAVRLFWGPGERAYVERIQRQAPGASVIPPASLRQMAALLSCCELVISNDNGPMHIAAAVGVPTITIYGPTDPAAWNPGGPRHRVLQADGLTCLGCNLNHCPFNHECMTGVTAERVFAECQKMLAGQAQAVTV